MQIIATIFAAIGVLTSGILLVFGLTSLREHELRAAILAFASSVGVTAGWYGLFWLLGGTVHIVWPIAVVALIAILFFAPLGKITRTRANPTGERVDERSVMFAREEYEPGGGKYEQYYAAHPEHKASDDRLRKLPRLLEPGGRYHDPNSAEEVRSTFARIAAMTRSVDGSVADIINRPDPEKSTAEWKAWALSHGADAVGVALMQPEWIYSHVGRGPEPWGEPIVNNHKYAVVFTMEMDYEAVASAPRAPIIRESARQYERAAEISVEMARRIRDTGYSARAHISDSNYQIMLPPVAQAAGLGEVGRMGYLISPRLGARIRLGAITTDLPLVADREEPFGVQNFCEVCSKCAHNCPSRAIPSGARTMVRGVEKWLLNSESCIYFWRLVGTDCGLCMKVCPYSHPPTFIHNLIRSGIRRSVVARRLAAWGDDFFYGRRSGWAGD